MKKRNCDTCYYSDMCRSSRPEDCDYYLPLEDDARIDAYIEECREAYRGAWFSYMEENED